MNGALDFKILLLENYKKLSLDENEVMTILMMDHLINEGNLFVTSDLLSLKMSMKTKEIDKVMDRLMERGFLTIETKGKHTITSIHKLKEILLHEFQVSFTLDRNLQSEKEIDEVVINLIGIFKELLSRPLAPLEKEKIKEWLMDGFSEEMIINALKEAVSKKKKTIRSVDKILISWAMREDLENEGHTTYREGWNKGLDDTIQIAKSSWIKKDE